MTTSTFSVSGLFSPLDAYGLERQLKQISGVLRVAVNPVSSSTTVDYDAESTDLPAIQSAVRACGFHCGDEGCPDHSNHIRFPAWFLQKR